MFLFAWKGMVVLQDDNRGAWYTAAVSAFAIVTRRDFLHDSAKSTAVTSLVVVIRAVSFQFLKLRIPALDFKRSG
jgi:hypothetical protein